jgi:hypothetical protein
MAWGTAAAAAGPAATRNASTAPALIGDWSHAEREAIASVLRQLPPAIVGRGPNAIVRDRTVCEADGLPGDDALLDAAGVAHLCVPAPEVGRLDVGRQVALALLFGFDRAVRWSDDAAWRRLNGWARSVTNPLHPRPDNLSAAGFAAPRGQRSPRWDLATFTVALLLDRPDGADDAVGCRLLSQGAFVRRRLAALGTAAGEGVFPEARCAAFERWADLDRLADIEVVLATPSTAMVASLFGHVFLRIVYRDDDGETPLHVSHTIAFLADNDVPFSADRTYALKGIAGFYAASLHERPFLEAYREYVVLEGRDLRRWRLNLTATERRDLMQRLWTAERAARYSYYFFRSNCATLMLDLIDQIRPPDRPIAVPGLLAAPPASLLEAWARERGADGAPLLQFVPEPLWSFDHWARITSRHRRELETRITATLDGEAGAVEATFRATHQTSADARAAAYERLATQLADRDAGVPADLQGWLRDSATIESHLSTLANLEAEARADRERHRKVGVAVTDLMSHLRADVALLRAASDGAGAVVADRLERAVRRVAGDDADDRLAGYRELRDVVESMPRFAGNPAIVDRVRLLALLQSEARYDVSRMKGVPGLRDALLFTDRDETIDRQPYVVGHEDLIRVPVETRVSGPLRSLQRARRALFVARGFGASDGAEEQRQADAESVIRAEGREYDAALSRSGIDQFGVLAGMVAGGTPAAPILTLTSALYDERIGDHRRFGFSSDTAMVVGLCAFSVSPRDGSLTLRSYESRLFGYRSVRQSLPESATARSPFGWELYLDLSGNSARNLAAASKLGWGLLAPVFERRELGDHLLVGLGLAYEAYFPGAGETPVGRQHGVAMPAAIEIRAGLGAMPRHRSWIGARIWAEPLAIGARVPDRIIVDAGATVEAHLALRARSDSGAHDPAILLRAQGARSALSFDGSSDRTEVMLSAGVELR